MRQVDLMIFDFDGTLVDSGADLAEAVNYTLGALKMPTKETRQIIGYVGDGVKKLLERSLDNKNRHLLDEALNIFGLYYEKHMMDNTKLYPHVLDVLQKFQEKIKVILTNKRFCFTMTIARRLEIDGYFAEIIGADSTPFQKPDKRLIDDLLAKYSAERNKTVMIGDGVNDIAVAKNSGVLSVAYLNGLGDSNALLSLCPDYSCESLLEINSLFI
ncbi:MAG TPA: HAD family hydrolase [Deltaproteobacteria bacterium]|nr:HAD family hydrolase [Deltaproteobacteria bacterium]